MVFFSSFYLCIVSTVNDPSVSVSTGPFTSEVVVLSSSSPFYSSTLLTTVTNTEGMWMCDKLLWITVTVIFSGYKMLFLVVRIWNFHMEHNNY